MKESINRQRTEKSKQIRDNESRINPEATIFNDELTAMELAIEVSL